MNESLEKQIKTLQEALSDKETALSQAALYGQGLLDTNTHLEETVFKLQTEYESKCEELEQLKYVFDMKTQVYEKSAKHFETNLHEEKQAIKLQFEKEQEIFTRKNSQEVSDLKKKVAEMQLELDEKSSLLKHMTEKINGFKDKISKLEANAIDINSSRKDELLTPEKSRLNNENQSLQKTVSGLTMDLEELQSNFHALELQNETLNKVVENLKCEKSTAEKNYETCSYAMEEYRQKVNELEEEIEVSRFTNEPHLSKGNSLFGEVEDKRVQAEKRLVSAHVKLKSLERKYTQQVNYNIQLKSQMFRLMQSGDCGAYKAKNEKLETALQESQSDTVTMAAKISELERKLGKKERSDLNSLVSSAQKDNHVVQFLEILLKKREKELENLQDDCGRLQLQLISESRKVTEAQQETFNANLDRDSLRSRVTKLSVEVTRLRMKCGEEVYGKKAIKWGRTEKVPETFEEPSDKENSTLPPNQSKVNQNKPNEEETVSTVADKNDGKTNNSNSLKSSDSECPPQCKQQ